METVLKSMKNLEIQKKGETLLLLFPTKEDEMYKGVEVYANLMEECFLKESWEQFVENLWKIKVVFQDLQQEEVHEKLQRQHILSHSFSCISGSVAFGSGGWGLVFWDKMWDRLFLREREREGKEYVAF